VYLYWSVQIDLDAIGCLLVLRDPNLNREFEKWVRKNAGGLAMAQDLTWNTVQRLCLSPN
jgi:hypothetical protein